MRKNMYISTSWMPERPEQPPVVLLRDVCVKLNIKLWKWWEGVCFQDREYKYRRQGDKDGGCAAYQANENPQAAAVIPN